jgi:hypothetical protein
LDEPKKDIFDTLDIFDVGGADPTIPRTPAAPPVVTSEPVPEQAPPLIQPTTEEPREFVGFFSELGTALQRGAARTGAAGLQFVERLSTPGSIFEPGTFSDLAEPLQDFAESAKVQPASIPKDAPTKDKVKAFVANAVGETIPFMGAATASVLATGTPLAAFGTSFAVEGEGARQDALREGASEEQADMEAFVVGTINGALEKLQIDEVLNFAGVGRGTVRSLIDAAKKKSLKKIAKEGGKLTLELAKTSVTEGVQEALQETTSVLAPGITGRELPTLEEGVKRVGLAAAGGAVAGPILGGALAQITPSAVEGEVITSVKEKDDGGQRDEERREELRARDRLVESEQRAEEAKTPVEARKRVVLEEGRQGLTEEGAVEAAPVPAKISGEQLAKGKHEGLAKAIKKEADTFILKDIDVSELGFDVTGRQFIDPEFSKKRLKQLEKQKTFLPIIVNKKGEVIDGNHRTLAAFRRGDKSIKAYVPAGVSQQDFDNLMTRLKKTGISVQEQLGEPFGGPIKKPTPAKITKLDDKTIIQEQAKQPESTIIPETPQIRQDVSDAVNTDVTDPAFPTSTKHASTKEIRERLGIGGINSKTRVSDEKLQRRAIKENVPERALRIADEINTSPRPLTSVEEAGFRVRVAQLEMEHEAVFKNIEKSKDDAEIQSLSAEANRIEQDFDNVMDALEAGGSEAGRAFRQRRVQIARDFSLVNTLNRAKAAKGAELTQKERMAFERTIKDLKQRVSAIEKARAEETAIIARGQLRRGTKRFTTMSKAQRKASSKTLGQDVMSLLERGCAN